MVADKLSRSFRVVSSSRGLPDDVQQVASTSSRPVCNKVQQVKSACVNSCRLPGLGSGCTQSTLGGSGLQYLPTSSHFGQSGGKTKSLVVRLPMQEDHPDRSAMAQHVLVLGAGVCQSKSDCSCSTCPIC